MRRGRRGACSGPGNGLCYHGDTEITENVFFTNASPRAQLRKDTDINGVPSHRTSTSRSLNFPAKVGSWEARESLACREYTECAASTDVGVPPSAIPLAVLRVLRASVVKDAVSGATAARSDARTRGGKGVRRAAAVIAFLLCAFARPVRAMEQRFPPPEFTTDYAMPGYENPLPRGFTDWMDIAALVAALSAASYLAIRRRSRRGLFWLGLASLAYFGFWRKGCICAVGAVQNVALAFADPAYAIPAVAAVFFLVPLAFTLLFGRTFCAAVCPLGCLQDVVAQRPVRVPEWLEKALSILRHVYLALAVLFAALGAGFVVCRFDPFVGLFRLSGSAAMLVLGACFLVVGVFVARPYCRYLCPYGALLGMASRLSRWRVTIFPEECIKCRLCEDTCPFAAIRTPTEGLGDRERTEGKNTLSWLLAAAPVIVIAGAAFGYLAGPTLARSHRTVALADRVRAEESGVVQGLTDETEAFRKTRRPVAGLYAEADALEGGFRKGGAVAGGYVALVLAVGLVAATVRRRREDYEADRGRCLACGRCYGYCPNERARRKENPADVDDEPPTQTKESQE